MAGAPESGSSGSRGMSWPGRQAALFAFLLLVAALSTRYQIPLMDDVYITLRHSLNFARGKGLVYNPGEHLLAATSPAWALFLSLFHPLTRDLTLPAIYGWPVFVAAAALLAWRLIGGGLPGLAGALLLCTEPSLDGVVGMDTALFVFCTLLGLRLFEQRRPKAAALLLGALPMVRPDGLFLIAAVAAVWAVENRRSLDAALLRRHVPLLALFALPLALWCAIAIPYYGSPLPHSFIGKYYQGRIRWWWADVERFPRAFLRGLGQWRYAALASGWMAGAAAGLARPDRVLRAGALWVAFYVAAYSVARVPAYANYFFPLYSMAIVVALRGVAVLARPWLRSEAVRRAGPAPVGALALAAVALVWSASDRTLFRGAAVRDDQLYMRIANFLARHTPADASVGAMEIGIIGYYSERRIVDFSGLASRGVARAAAAGDRRFAIEHYHPDYVVARHPQPAALEGGLTATELARDYRWIYGTAGVGVFQPVHPGAPAPSGDLAAYADTIFILRQPLAARQIAELNASLSKRGSAVAASYPRSEHDIRGKRFSYVTFAGGRPIAITPMLEPQEVALFSEPVRLEFDRQADRLGAWNEVAVMEPAGSAIHLSTTGTDPYVAVPTAPFAPWFLRTLRIRLRARPAAGCGNPDGALLWTTNLDPAWGARGKAVGFPVEADGLWHEIAVDLSGNAAWNGSGIVTGLRYDPIRCPAELDVDYIRIE